MSADRENSRTSMLETSIEYDNHKDSWTINSDGIEVEIGTAVFRTPYETEIGPVTIPRGKVVGKIYFPELTPDNEVDFKRKSIQGLRDIFSTLDTHGEIPKPVFFCGKESPEIASLAKQIGFLTDHKEGSEITRVVARVGDLRGNIEALIAQQLPIVD